MNGYIPAPTNRTRASNHTRVGLFSGYMNVESRNELALMEAVAKYGPIAVSVNAGRAQY